MSDEREPFDHYRPAGGWPPQKLPIPNPVPSIPSREAVDDRIKTFHTHHHGALDRDGVMLRDLLAEVERLREFRNKVTTIAEWHEEEATIEELNDKRLMHEAYARVLRSL